MQTTDVLKDSVIFLAAAVVSVPLSKKLGLGAVLGYLLAGVIIGPWVLGLIKEPENLLHFSEFGVVMFLFMVGLELKPQRLWKMRNDIVGTGTIQVVLSTLAIAAAAYVATGNFGVSLLAGMGLSLSSTALALQAIQERHLMSSPAGEKSFSILLFQDLAVIPMLAIVPLLASTSAATTLGAESIAESQSPWLGALKVFGVIAAIVTLGSLITRPVFRVIATTGVREIFTATSLLLVIGIALVMDSVGMSMALGTFLAGVILSESEYRHELESSVEPFKSILLGLFFISVGMSLNPSLLLKNPLLIVLAVFGFVGLKIIILMFIGKRLKLDTKQSLLMACLISQASEFAFVLFGVAQSTKVLSAEAHATLSVIVTLSLLTTPIIMMFADRLTLWLDRKSHSAASQVVHEDEFKDLEDAHVLIAGFGRFGQIVARLLHSCHMQTTVLDHDPSHIESLRKFGFKVYYGDATRLDLLETAGLAKAKLFICAIDDVETSLEVVKLVKQHYPKLKILSRCRNLTHYFELRNVDVEHISRETFGSALETGEEALKQLGFTAYSAHVVAKRFRKRDEEGNRAAYNFRKANANNKNFTDFAKNSRAQLEEQLKQENRAFLGLKDEGWG